MTTMMIMMMMCGLCAIATSKILKPNLTGAQTNQTFGHKSVPILNISDQSPESFVRRGFLFYFVNVIHHRKIRHLMIQSNKYTYFIVRRLFSYIEYMTLTYLIGHSAADRSVELMLGMNTLTNMFYDHRTEPSLPVPNNKFSI